MDNKKTELVVTRMFDAPRAALWKAWTDPEMVKRWWGPKDFTAPFVKIDLRVGGSYLFCMRSPDGHDYWSTGVYREIVPNEKIVCTDSFSDKEGNIIPASAYGMKGEWPMELLMTAIFEDVNGKTKFTLRYSGFPPGDDAEMAGVGWKQSFDKLESALYALSSK